MEPLRKNSVNYGVLLGVFMILATAIIYAVDLDLFTNAVYGVVNFIIIAAFGVLSAIKSKKSLGGFMTFKQAFTAFFITILIGLTISTLFSILLFNFIDPDAKAVIMENVIKSTAEMMEKFGTPASEIEKIAEEMEKTDSFGPMGQLQGFVMNLIIYSIVGLIAALIVKRDRPESL